MVMVIERRGWDRLDLTDEERKIVGVLDVGENAEVLFNPLTNRGVKLTPEGLAVFDLFVGAYSSGKENLALKALSVLVKNWPMETAVLLEKVISVKTSSEENVNGQ